MLNLNPFKRKPSYDFDNMELPKLKDMDSFQEHDDNINTEHHSENSDFDNSQNNPMPNQDNFNEPTINPEEKPDDFSQVDTTELRGSDFSHEPYSDKSSFQSPKPIIEEERDNSNTENEILKTILKRVENKINLVNEKISTLNEKLDKIDNIIQLEVSDTTKRKIKIDSFKEKMNY